MLAGKRWPGSIRSDMAAKRATMFPHELDKPEVKAAIDELTKPE